MKRADVLRTLKRHLPEMKRRFGVAHLALFGSTSRDTAGPDSGVA